MGDAGEGLIDAEARIQERIDEREHAKKNAPVMRGDPNRVSQLESLRLARTELQRQLTTTAHQARKQQLEQAIGELDRRIAQLG